MSDKLPFLIGYSGRKGSGKDTCARALSERIAAEKTHIVQTFAFANPMKRVCMQYFGLTYEQCFGTNDEKNSPTSIAWCDFPVKEVASKYEGYMTARQVLQFFGTEVIRKMLPNAHVNALLWDIRLANVNIAQIVDVRFPNEVEAVKANGGKVIRLTRIMFPEDNHESEVALDPEHYDWSNFDFILDNRDLTVCDQDEMLAYLMVRWNVLNNA